MNWTMTVMELLKINWKNRCNNYCKYEQSYEIDEMDGKVN